MKTTKSTHAAAASAIKQELKKLLNIKASTKSESFSGGDAVRVKVINQSAKSMQAIEDICAKYKYGKFDGMTDCYEYSNRNDNLPQVKYITISNDWTDDKIQDAIDKVNARYNKNATLEQYQRGNLPALYDNGGHWNDFANEVRGVMDGSIDYELNNKRRTREEEVIKALKENHNFDYYADVQGIYIYFDNDVWSIDNDFKMTEYYNLDAAIVAETLYDAHSAALIKRAEEMKAYQAERERLNKKIEPLAISTKEQELTLYFPVINKNNTIEENNDYLLEDARKEEITVTKSIILSADDYQLVSESLLTERGYLWCGADCIAVINADDVNDRFYVYTSGYQYSRYVGVDADTMAILTANNILKSFVNIC